ncbi:MAG: hypothetical protein JO353_07780 [Phycisphaerae bacterium]|nr:hypothetical protein [Phycisphaerae bacterium]
MLLPIAVGCSVNPPIQPRQDPYVPSQIHVDSEQLREDTAVGTPNVHRDENGILYVNVPIRSAIDKTLYVDYYVTFFDKNGQPIGQRMGPFTKTFDPNTPSSITVNSTTPRAADFQIDLRYAR